MKYLATYGTRSHVFGDEFIAGTAGDVIAPTACMDRIESWKKVRMLDR